MGSCRERRLARCLPWVDAASVCAVYYDLFALKRRMMGMEIYVSHNEWGGVED